MAHRLKHLLAVFWIALMLVAFAPTTRAEPPVIVIVSPANGEIVSGVYQIVGEASDDLGVTNVEVRIDVGEWRNATDTSGNGSWASWAFEWDTTLYANGWHDVWARAWDANDTHGFDRNEVQVHNEPRGENHAPWVNIHFPRQESTVCGEFFIEGHAGDDDTNDSVESVQVRFREGRWMDATPTGPDDGYGRWTLFFDSTAYDNGWGRLDARSFDGELYSDLYDVWIRILNPCEDENQRPWVRIDHPSHGSRVEGVIVISGRSGDPDEGDRVELVQVRIGHGEWFNAIPLGPDGDPWRTWAVEWDTRELENGWYTICARSFDGQLYSEIPCIEVFVHNEHREENHRPVVRIHIPANGDRVSGFVIIRGGAEDPDEPRDRVEMVWVRIDGGEWMRADDVSGDGTFHRWARGWNTREWANGEHQICARSWDGELYSELHCIRVFVHNEHREEENQRPRVDITHPADGSEVNGLVRITGTAEDDVRVLWVEWRIDGHDANWRDAFDTSGDGSWSTWEAFWHTEEFEDGCYAILARAWDGHLYSEIDHVRVCVNNHPDDDRSPVVDITEPRCGSTVHDTVAIRGTSEDDHEVVLVEVRIDDGPWMEATRDGPDGGWGRWVFEWHTREYDNGEHHVYARALDNAGQYSEVDVCGYLVHNDPNREAPPEGPGLQSLLPPVSSMGLIGFLGAALVRRKWLGSTV